MVTRIEKNFSFVYFKIFLYEIHRHFSFINEFYFE